MNPRVVVQLVTYNSEAELPGCLASLAAQTGVDFEVAVWDNASWDASARLAREFGSPVAWVSESGENLGFSAGHNRILATRPAPFHLFLNPDTILPPNFLAAAVSSLEAHPECGSLSPLLLRLGPDGEAPEPEAALVDSAGIVWTRNQRHLDRGAGETHRGQYAQAEYVFGVTGAAALYRRSCLEDVAFEGEIWDEDFFLYREDADLAWRAAWRGWKCLFDPGVTAWHARRVVPENRRETSALANLHSVKNRFLLRLKNMPLATFIRFAPAILVRDLMVVGGVFLREWSSLPAFPQVIRLLPRFLRKRRHVLGRAQVPRKELDAWFLTKARPLPGKEGA